MASFLSGKPKTGSLSAAKPKAQAEPMNDIPAEIKQRISKSGRKSLLQKAGNKLGGF